MLIGVISDTHGLLRPQAVAALQGCSHIIHAGDIGGPEIMADLGKIAPVTAVRGNMDRGAWAHAYPVTASVVLGNKLFYVLHDLSKLDLVPGASGFHVVISGHSHQPFEEIKDGVLFLNPGSAGPKRFNLPVCLALLQLADESMSTRLVELKII